MAIGPKSSDVDPIVDVNAAITAFILAVGTLVATGAKYVQTIFKLSKDNPKELAGAFVATAWYFVWNCVTVFLTAAPNDFMLTMMVRFVT
jgi:hypothetical protein